MMSTKRILVPVNFGSQSDAALKYASKISGIINGMITCLHVIEDEALSQTNSCQRTQRRRSEEKPDRDYLLK